METIVVMMAACIFAVYVPECVIQFLSRQYIDKPLKEYFDNHSEEKDLESKELKPLPMYLGRLERPLYVLAYYLKQPDFIGLWLTLKAAGNWPLWNPPDGASPHVGRARFITFLIRSGLSLASAVLIALFAIWVINQHIHILWHLVLRSLF